MKLGGRSIGLSLDAGLKPGRFGHLRTEVNDCGGGNSAEPEHDAPGQTRAESRLQEHEADEWSDDETDGLHGEDEAYESAPITTIGELAHHDCRHGVVAPDAETENEPRDNKKNQIRREGRGECADHHHDRDNDVHVLASEDVGDSTESERPDERPQNGRAGDPTRLCRREVPLELEDRGDRANHEEVVRVGEKPHTRDENRTSVESAHGSLVEQLIDRESRRTVNGGGLASGRDGAVEGLLARLRHS